MIDPTYLTKSSQNKYTNLPITTEKIDPKLKKILDTMFISFQKKLIMEHAPQIKIKKMQKIFIKFHNMFSKINDSKFITDVNNFDRTMTFTLTTLRGKITLNFIYSDNKSKIIAAITHALHTFCHFFDKINYDGLIIYICLDDNKRDLMIPNKYKTYDKKIMYLQKNSSALNVSGMTDKNKKIIFLTKTEEIVKLMFHEMVHYIGLDEKLLYVHFTNNWAISPSELNISETYTEFMAVLLNAAYQTIQLWIIDVAKPIEQIYKTMLDAETAYSFQLTANILKFYGYDQNTYKKFFNGVGHKNLEPIPLWEYIFLRTICMLHMTFFPTNYVMEDVGVFVKLLKNDHELVEKVGKYIETPIELLKNDRIKIQNVSYNMIDLDWLKI